MLIRIEIENFYSVRERQVLDFRVPQTTPESERLWTAPYDPTVRVPKVLAFFGANASGKTTILRAVSFLTSFVERSFNSYQPDAPIIINPFKHSDTMQGTSQLAMEFSPSESTNSEVSVYRYELAIAHEGSGSNSVASETLKSSSDGKYFSTVFDRQRSGDGYNIKINREFDLPKSDPRRSVRKNVSLISSLVQFAHEPSRIIAKEFDASFITNINVGKVNFTDDFVTTFVSEHPKALEELNRVIRTIDVGIESVEFLEVEGKKVPVFRHAGLDGVQILHYESQGTKNFYCLFPILMFALKTGAVGVLDEIDSDLHPGLMGEIVRWFQSPDENLFEGQLIMTCHNASILSHLEKEEVWFVEKNERGESSTTALSEFGGVRRDTNFYSKYLGGAFGAVPSFG